MNVITEPLRSLVRRKLWPVAVLLVGALVAVPLTLAKEPVTTAPAAPSTVEKDAGLPAAFVSAATDTEAVERRRVLGAEKDPFEPAPLKKTKNKSEAQADSGESTSKDAGTAAAKGSGGAAATGGGGGEAEPGAEPPASEPAAATEMLPRYSIRVSFGQVDGELETQTVERLTVLPSEDSPLLVYQGVEQGGKVAVFELTGSVVAEGDGRCEPGPEDCQILKLRAGETEFITITDTGGETDAQYQLELEKIYTKETPVSGKTADES